MAMPVERVTAKTVAKVLRDHVDVSATLYTDEAGHYETIGKEFASHQVVNHSRREYARDGVSTNEAEAFFALLKRGIVGSFHSVSKQHLARYCDEFSFRWNHRKVSDGERTIEAIRGGEGRRLMYRSPAEH
jgi:transposase-like protein